MRLLLLGLFSFLGLLLPAVAQEPMPDAPAATGMSQRFLVEGLPDAATAVAIDPAGEWLVVGSYDCLEVWSLDKKAKAQRIPLKTGFLRSLAFSPDGAVLATGGYQAITLFDTKEWTPRPRLKGHRGYVNELAFQADGKTLFSASDDMTCREWDVAAGTERRIFKKFTDPVASVAVSPDGRFVATASGDETRLTRVGELQIWNRESSELVHTLPPHKKPPTDVAFSPDGKFLASGSFDEKVNVYEAETGKALGFFGGHQRPTNCVAFLDGGRLVVSGCGGRFKGGNQVRIWTREEGEVVAGADFESGKVTDIALSGDGRRLAASLDSGRAAVFDLEQSLFKGTPAKEALETAVLPTKPVAAPRGVAPGTPSFAVSFPAAAELAQADAVEKVESKKPEESDKPAEPVKPIRIGLIGLDTSHSIAFTKVLNSEKPKPEFAGCRIVAAYPWGSRDIESSTSRIPGYTEEVKKLGVEIVDSVEALIPLVDCVLLETNDGRPHLEQVLPVLKAKKPVFVDKPVAASLVDCLAIYQAAKESGTPLFSSSSLRFIPESLKARQGEYGKVIGCDAFSPCSLEKTHPDLFWYGIHGCEILFTVMGPGCETVTRASTADTDLVTGIWKDGRIGTFRGTRTGKSGYGGNVFGEKQTVPLGNFKGYEPLVVEIVKFFRTGKPPVEPEETIAIYAFMEAADESKRQGGKPVSVADVLKKAQADVAGRLQSLSR